MAPVDPDMESVIPGSHIWTVADFFLPQKSFFRIF